jgi:hypothetical protein
VDIHSILLLDRVHLQPARCLSLGGPGRGKSVFTAELVLRLEARRIPFEGHYFSADTIILLSPSPARVVESIAAQCATDLARGLDMLFFIEAFKKSRPINSLDLFHLLIRDPPPLPSFAKIW